MVVSILSVRRLRQPANLLLLSLALTGTESPISWWWSLSSLSGDYDSPPTSSFFPWHSQVQSLLSPGGGLCPLCPETMAACQASASPWHSQVQSLLSPDGGLRTLCPETKTARQPPPSLPGTHRYRVSYLLVVVSVLSVWRLRQPANLLLLSLALTGTESPISWWWSPSSLSGD